MAYDLTLSNASFTDSGAFGQSLSGGYGTVTSPLPTSGPVTIEGRGKTSATGVQVLTGSSYGAWIGTTADGKAQAHYGGSSSGGSDVTVTTNVTVNDGQSHEYSFNIDPQGTGARLFVDGVLAGSNGAQNTIKVENPFGVRVFGGNTAYGWNGSIDYVAIYSGIKRTGAYTPATSSPSNTDPNLIALWQLDGDGANSASAATPTAPNAPIIGNATAGDGSISVAFSAASTGTAATSFKLYVYKASDNSLVGTATGTTSPAQYTGATNGVAVYGKVTGLAGGLESSPSSSSNTVTPTASSGSVQITYNDAKLVYSPYNWDDLSTYRVSATPGAYVKAAFTGTSIAAKIDVSAMVSASLPAGSYPLVRTVIDGMSFVDTQLTSSTTAITRNGLSNGSHTLELYFLATDIHNGDRWNTPVNAVRITGFMLDAGAALGTYATRSKTSLHFGDSISEGYLAVGTTSAEPAGSNCLFTAVPILAQAFDCEYGSVAFSGQGYQQAGNGNVPAWPSAYNLFSAGRSRLVNGKFSPAPDYIFVEHGANGSTSTANVQSMIANLRAAAPAAKILMLVPAGGYARSAITAGVAAAADANTFLIDIGTGYQAGISSFGSGPNMWSYDGLHRNLLSNSRVGAAFAQKTQAALAGAAQPSLTARTVSLTLATGTDSNGQPMLAASLSNIKVAAFDEPTPDLRTAPRYKSATQTTNSAGVMTFVMQSTLAAGGTCGVSVQLADGRNFDFAATVS